MQKRHPQCKVFPIEPLSRQHSRNERKRTIKVNFCRTKKYQNSAIAFAGGCLISTGTIRREGRRAGRRSAGERGRRGAGGRRAAVSRLRLGQGAGG